MTWRNLKEFAEWYWYTAEKGHALRPRVQLPLHNQVKVSEGSHELILFREGQYQAELITLYANREVQPHRHPDVASVDVHLCGTGEAYIAGRLMPPAHLEGHPLSTRRRLTIPRNVEHWGRSETNVVVLSLQKWYDGVTPTFITDNWEGLPWK